ncbi:MAG: chromate transporter [Spirochaetaceae bacterium]|jgi:chromate transporter|nr:chromate transporter [Spirochaetaceae bacterium]
MKDLCNIFFVFLKMGCITFGGGYAMVPVVERELIKKRGWVTMDEVMDYYTIAQVTPGIIAVNLSTFVGCKRKGPLGGLLATVGFILPGVCLMVIVSLFVQRFAEYAIVQHAFAGIRIAVGALILDTVIKLCKGAFKDYKSVIIFIIVFALSAFVSANPALLVVAAGVAGWLLYGRKLKNHE